MPAPEFFNVQPVAEALRTLFTHYEPVFKLETIDPRQALGRILGVAPTAPFDLPIFRRSTMDGYAVIAQDTFGASETLPTYLTCVGSIGMGEVVATPLERTQTIEIFTGGMIPPQADAVVMIEKTQRINTTEIEILSPVAPGENIIQIGEDVAQGDEVLPVGHCLRPQDIGGLLALGIPEIQVVQRPRIGILSCGDELIAPDTPLTAGKIIDINAYTLAGLVTQHGGEPILLGIAEDNLASYQTMAQQGFAKCDLLIMTAGSSVSTRDLTHDVIQGLGEPGILQHGLAVKPGKPTILAVCDNKPVIGLPGNPVSAYLVAQQIVVPILEKALGLRPTPRITLTALLTNNITSTTGRDDRVPVRMVEKDGQIWAEPIFGKSNLIYTLVKADGWVQVPLNSNGLKAGTAVVVELFE